MSANSIFLVFTGIVVALATSVLLSLPAWALLSSGLLLSLAVTSVRRTELFPALLTSAAWSLGIGLGALVHVPKVGLAPQDLVQVIILSVSCVPVYVLANCLLAAGCWLLLGSKPHKMLAK